ncbi:MAG: ornithine carbamoyltransferase [Caldimonas sp.]
MSSSADVNAVLSQARALQSAARTGAPRPMMRGKNLGLLCDSEDTPSALLFRRAALELGAHVSYIRPSLSERSSERDVQHTARLLGRLYDAIECQGAAQALAVRIGAEAGVPVYGGVACPDHPMASLAVQLGNDMSPDDNRCFVIQAVLLTTIA